MSVLWSGIASLFYYSTYRAYLGTFRIILQRGDFLKRGYGNSVFPLVPHFGIVSLIDSIVRIGAFRISDRSLHKCEALLFPFYPFKFILRVIYKQ